MSNSEDLGGCGNQASYTQIREDFVLLEQKEEVPPDSEDLTRDVHLWQQRSG